MTALQLSLTDLICNRVKLHLETQRTNADGRPLFVGVQGPQGAGKTTAVRRVQHQLSTECELSVVVISLDDFYLPHHSLVQLASANPDNWLFQGRGLPGTHDIELAESVLNRLSQINDEYGVLELPSFDKSLFGGAGDRSPPGKGTLVKSPVDVVILEGWCLGFYPLDKWVLEERYNACLNQLPRERPSAPPDLADILQRCSLGALQMVNEALEQHSQHIYPRMSMLIQV